MIPQASHPNLLVGTNTADDAGVFKLTDEIALVQTIDVFTPVVDDPFDYGQISAANSLSDVYAMGGKPVTALNFVGFPKKIIGLDILAEILRGAAAKADEAGCPIVGGHTVTDDELKFGLSVTGIVHPDKIKSNATAKVGDKLILTKPLGIGILSTALKNGKLDEPTTRKITTVMSQLNKTAAELMIQFDANSATDVTGFGLLGHASEMAKGSGLSFILSADSIPYLPETLEKTKQGGFIPGGSWDNKSYLQDSISFSDSINEHLQMIFFDVQTSGGLIISISADKSEELLLALHENGVEASAIIGEVVKKNEKVIRVE
jgi:selenide, water dikinase